MIFKDNTPKKEPVRRRYPKYLHQQPLNVERHVTLQKALAVIHTGNLNSYELLAVREIIEASK